MDRCVLTKKLNGSVIAKANIFYSGHVAACLEATRVAHPFFFCVITNTPRKSGSKPNGPSF